MANEKNNTAAVGLALLGANDGEKIITYDVNGEEVKLSFSIVRNFLTRGGANVTDAEVVQFIWLCRANALNPFVGDAYMVKYGRNDGRMPEPAQMIIAKGAFMKRAESSPQYTGYKAGVILLRDGNVVESEGSFFLRGDILVGGWAMVWRSDRQFPVVARVRLEEYNTGKSTWAAKPGTMIRKVAIAQAFREAFPLIASAMYTPEEMPAPDYQNGEAPMELENKEAPEFTPDREAPDFTPDPEPADDGPDPALVKAGLVYRPKPEEDENPVNDNLFKI